MSVQIKVKASGTAGPKLNGLRKRASAAGGGPGKKKLFDRIWFTVMSKSIALNFKGGGRPKKWARSQRAIKQGGVTLSDTGRLKSSIRHKMISRGIAIGTNVKYAEIHQKGFKGNIAVSSHNRTIKKAFGKPLKSPVTFAVRAHSKRVTLPKRPFLLVQKKDKTSIKNLIRKWLRGKF